MTDDIIRKGEDTQRSLLKDGGRDRSYCHSEGKPVAADTGKAKEGFFPSAFGGSMALLTP